MFYNNNRYIPEWKLRVIHVAAKLVGVVVHVDGMPYGSSKRYRLESEPGLSRGSASRSSFGGL